MIGRDTEERIGRVAEMIREAKRIVVFTGAGVSTESGIPDFRSPGGLWSRFDPDDFTIERFLASPETRRKQWRFLVAGGLFKDARPNAAHTAIAELEALGRLECVITQNIDNLHQMAGNDPRRVYELHGNMRWIRCLDCGDRTALEEILKKYRTADDPPACERCGGIMKPDVIFFGEALPEETLRAGDPACEPVRPPHRRRLVARRLSRGHHAVHREGVGGKAHYRQPDAHAGRPNR